MQECGSCTECCYAFPVVELDKKANELCRYINKGCSVYEIRPESCKKCLCAWVTQPNVSPDLRPDKCGVIFERDDNMIVATVVGIVSDIVRGQIKEFKRQGFEVVINDCT